MDISSEDIHAAVFGVFECIPRAITRQRAKETHSNAGELSMHAVSTILSRCEITESDVFLDVGSGIGNVIAQAALESRARICTGIELRDELVEVGSRLIREHRDTYPLLDKVSIVGGDIRNERSWSHATVAAATILLSFNKVFTPDANRALENACVDLPELRMIIVSEPFCHRHRESCSRIFCASWRKLETIDANVSYSSNAIKLHIYTPLILKKIKE